MADDLENPSPELTETSAIETGGGAPGDAELESTGTEPDLTGAELDADETGDGETTEPEDVELDFGFKKYRVKPKLKEAVEAWQATMTQKSQAVAERERALEAERRQQVQLDEQETDARVALRVLDAQLEEYAKVDWAAARQKDWAAATEAFQEYQQLQGQRAQAAGFIEQRTQARRDYAQRDFAKRKDDTVEWARKNITGWNKDVDAQITQTAVTLGMTPEYLAQNLNPLLYKFLHYTRIGYQVEQRSKSAKTASAPPEPAETPRKGGSAIPPGQLSDKLGADEWIKRRNAQLARRGA